MSLPNWFLSGLRASRPFAVIVGLSVGSTFALTAASISAQTTSSGVEAPAAEAALAASLPPNARIIGSRLLNPNRAEVDIEQRGQISSVTVQQVKPGDWRQDMSATLARAGAEMQLLAQNAASPSPALASPSAGNPGEPLVPATPSEDLLGSTRAAASLILPLDPEQEKRRAELGAGRADPFAPISLDVPTLAPVPVLPAVPALPPLASLPQLPIATPTPDPARFAKTIKVSGVMEVGGESFAFISATGAVPGVVRTGDRYQSALVARVSVDQQEIVLQEGGQYVTRRVEEPPIAIAQ